MDPRSRSQQPQQPPRKTQGFGPSPCWCWPKWPWSECKRLQQKGEKVPVVVGGGLCKEYLLLVFFSFFFKFHPETWEDETILTIHCYLSNGLKPTNLLLYALQIAHCGKSKWLITDVTSKRVLVTYKVFPRPRRLGKRYFFRFFLRGHQCKRAPIGSMKL